jgi:hypothetical protein
VKMIRFRGCPHGVLATRAAGHRRPSKNTALSVAAIYRLLSRSSILPYLE